MQTIYLVPLSTPQTLTQAAWRRLTSADRLFLLSAQHPCARPVLDAGLAFTAMDDLYEAAEDFDALQTAIARRLLGVHADCTLAVTGAPDALAAALRREAEGRVQVVILPGVPLGLAAFPESAGARRCCANALPERVTPSETLLIEELDTRLLAGEVKLYLQEYFPDDWEVELAVMQEDGSYAVERLPLDQLDRRKRYGVADVLRVPAAPFEALTRYGVDELFDVLRRLRAPGGCPWDREQTHRTIKEALLEECYETMDAIDREDDDDLVEELGGPPIPGVGFGLGIERLLLLMEANQIEIPEADKPEVFVAVVGEAAKAFGLKLCRQLRQKGVIAEMDTLARNIKGQFKYADRLGARYTLVIGEDELAKGVVSLKDMSRSEQREIAIDKIYEEIKK